MPLESTLVVAATVAAVSAVADTAAAAVPPIAGGDARYVEKPAPLTVLLADRVVNAPVFGVVAPTVPLCGPTRPVFAVIVVPVIAAAVVPPMAGGDARYVEKPAPLTVLLAESVVNAPVLGVVAPTAPLIEPANPVFAVIVVPVIAAAAVPPIAGGDAR